MGEYSGAAVELRGARSGFVGRLPVGLVVDFHLRLGGFVLLFSDLDKFLRHL